METKDGTIHTEKIHNEIIERILSEIRNKYGDIDLKKLAKESGVHYNTLRDNLELKKNKSGISLKLLVIISKVLDVPLERFVSLSVNKKHSDGNLLIDSVTMEPIAEMLLYIEIDDYRKSLLKQLKRLKGIYKTEIAERLQKIKDEKNGRSIERTA